MSCINRPQWLFRIMRLKVSGKEEIIDIEPTDPIQTVKEKLEEVEGTSVDQQRLIYNGKILRNEKSVESYRLKNGALLQMVKALRSK